jgi:hypothetical protein
LLRKDLEALSQKVMARCPIFRLDGSGWTGNSLGHVKELQGRRLGLRETLHFLPIRLVVILFCDFCFAHMALLAPYQTACTSFEKNEGVTRRLYATQITDREKIKLRHGNNLIDMKQENTRFCRET